MNIKCIHYNWYATSDPNYPEQQTIATVGQLRCESITEYRAQGDGDKWYYDINYSDERIERVFNPNRVFLEP